MPMEYRSEVIGGVIRRLRQEAGLSQEVLSGLAGIHRSHLSMIETGAKQPNLKTIWCIASALNLRPSQLVALFEAESQDG